MDMDDFGVLWVWGFSGDSHGFLWVWDGYVDWNTIPTAALIISRAASANAAVVYWSGITRFFEMIDWLTVCQRRLAVTWTKFQDNRAILTQSASSGIKCSLQGHRCAVSFDCRWSSKQTDVSLPVHDNVVCERMKIYEDQLTSDPLQFGFKKHSGCCHALFTFKHVTKYFIKKVAKFIAPF